MIRAFVLPGLLFNRSLSMNLFFFQFVNPKLFEISSKVGFGGNKGNRFGFNKFNKGGQNGGPRQYTRFGNNGGGFKAGIKSGDNLIIISFILFLFRIHSTTLFF